MITAAQLRAMYPLCTQANAQTFELPISDAMREFLVDTPRRQAAFLGQVGHESGQLHYVREIWGPTPWQLQYEGKSVLGNDQPGDGRRFLGRGLIQITGRANYRTCSRALFQDEGVLIDQPERLEEPLQASRSAAWFWQAHGLNELADVNNYERITKRINTTMLGYAPRVQCWIDAKRVLEVV